MGFWGYFIVARSERPLVDLGAITTLCSPDQVPEWSGEPMGSRTDGAWQFLQVHRGDPSATEWLAKRLSAETGAPALAIYVMDGDYGHIVAASPTGAGLQGYLAPSIAEAEGMPALDVTTEEIGEAAARWASEAGQVADVQAIIAALAERPGPFGAGVHGLMNALGFRFGQRQGQ
jgi:hypothetical protein